MKRQLILSTLFNMRFADVEPFLRSLRRSNTTCDIVFFVSRVTAEDQKKLRDLFNVQCIEFNYLSIRMRQPYLLFWPIWKRLFPKLSTFESRTALARRVFNLFFLRFLLYYDFLQPKVDEYDKIIITDCRDVIFQIDPFASDDFAGVNVFAEREGNFIGGCKANSRMLLDCFDEGVLKELSNSQIYCAGVTIGDSRSILKYCRKMVESAFAVRHMALVPGADQGLHNFLVHRRQIEGLVLHANNAANVSTMGALNQEEIQLNSEGLVVGSNHQVIPILHQYDRHKDLAASLRSKLAV